VFSEYLRNIDRFPDDFMFQLTMDEVNVLKCQIGTSILRSQTVTSKDKRGGRRYLPYVFTEQGVAMLSSVLRSKRAILVNINRLVFIRKTGKWKRFKDSF